VRLCEASTLSRRCCSRYWGVYACKRGQGTVQFGGSSKAGDSSSKEHSFDSRPSFDKQVGSGRWPCIINSETYSPNTTRCTHWLRAVLLCLAVCCVCCFLFAVCCVCCVWLCAVLLVRPCTYPTAPKPRIPKIPKPQTAIEHLLSASNCQGLYIPQNPQTPDLQHPKA
jgi:hypothetical protein